jgi:hypothetical protein
MKLKDVVEVFDHYFTSGERDFYTWLDEYLVTRRSSPFQFGPPTHNELGDLLRFLRVDAKGKRAEIIQAALVSKIKRSAESSDLQKLAQLAEAVAYSGWISTSNVLANGTDLLLRNLRATAALSQVDQQQKAIQTYLALDSIIAGLCRFARDEDASSNPEAKRVVREFLYDDDLAPFASMLFAPVAMHDLSHWPEHFQQLISQCARTKNVFKFKLSAEHANENLYIKSAYFDVLSVLEEFLVAATLHFRSFQSVIQHLNLTTSAQVAFELLATKGRVTFREESGFWMTHFTEQVLPQRYHYQSAAEERESLLEAHIYCAVSEIFGVEAAIPTKKPTFSRLSLLESLTPAMGI